MTREVPFVNMESFHFTNETSRETTGAFGSKAALDEKSEDAIRYNSSFPRKRDSRATASSHALDPRISGVTNVGSENDLREQWRPSTTDSRSRRPVFRRPAPRARSARRRDESRRGR